MAKRPRPANSIPMDSGSPQAFLRLAFEKIPNESKFVLAGMALFAGAALVLGWVKSFDLSTTLAIAILIVVFGVILAALTAASTLAGPGIFLAWALSVLFVGVLCLIVSAAFFGVPPAGAVMLSRMFGSSEILTSLPSRKAPILVPIGQTEMLQNLPREVRQEPQSNDVQKRILELSSLPELEVSGILKIADASERRVLSASNLRLENGGTIVTSGGDLTIEVNNLIADNGIVQAFPDPRMASPGKPGLSGGKVTIIVHGRILGRLKVDLQGQRGANGAAGNDGAKGANGSKGDNASSGVVDCSRGAGRGNNGSPGENGGQGQPGFAGGDGGHLTIKAVDEAAAKTVIEAILTGGEGGEAGIGGKPGAGGDPGPGGSQRGWCQGDGPAGEQGATGQAGEPGSPGSAGADGKIRFISFGNS